MSDYLEYFDFDAYMADTQVEPFDFAFLNGQPSTTHGGYDPNPSPSDLPGANAGTMDSGTNITQQLPTKSLPIEPENTAKPKAISEHCCRECQESFNDIWLLERHAKATRHAAFVCSISDCGQTFMTVGHLFTHKDKPHAAGHQQKEGLDPFSCIECNTAFENQAQLHIHSNTHQHNPLACTCGVKFARVDVLNRHIRNFSKDTPGFPCTYCRSHRGKAGFRRREHLVQHLEGYHKLDPEEIEKACPKKKVQGEHDFLVCPRQGCDAHRDDAFHSLPWSQRLQSKPFKSRGDYGKHMKEVHKETPFPCTVAECDRVGAKGYMRERDLIKHLSNKHPEAPQYEAKIRESRHSCPVDGCRRSYATSSDLRLHEIWVHWSVEDDTAWLEYLRSKSS
ncbi:hypothetical protein DL767_007382 [Monosporascus sp. MG133]|nr:hypothetical protein DL767_007382 [Monosporascus sp. MG133]